MTVPTSQAFATFSLHISDAPGLDKLLIELRMTPDAVVHDDIGRSAFSHNGLTFGIGHKISHMLHPIHPLEEILLEDVLMGHVAIITGGIPSM